MTSLIVLLLVAYLTLNFLCALALHLHGEKQAHLRPRFLDVLVHFVLMTAFAIPVLLIVTVEAMFGGNSSRGMRKPAKVAATPTA